MPAQPSRCSPGEFSTLPSETWHGEPRHDWRHVLRHSGRAITHSSFTVDVVRAAMGRDYPVLSVPAPVWDRFANRASQQAGRPKPGMCACAWTAC